MVAKWSPGRDEEDILDAVFKWLCSFHSWSIGKLCLLAADYTKLTEKVLMHYSTAVVGFLVILKQKMDSSLSTKWLRLWSMRFNVSEVYMWRELVLTLSREYLAEFQCFVHHCFWWELKGVLNLYNKWQSDDLLHIVINENHPRGNRFWVILKILTFMF